MPMCKNLPFSQLPAIAGQGFVIDMELVSSTGKKEIAISNHHLLHYSRIIAEECRPASRRSKLHLLGGKLHQTINSSRRSTISR